ncbi:MAG: hypothetical protein ACR2O4_02230 [Hyphomicrobiaceae bacterium]
MPDEKSIAAEIVALHEALAVWLSGRCPHVNAFFEKEFRARFHPEFFNIQPAGIVLTRADLLHTLDNGYGRSRDFHIRIRNVQLRQIMAPLILATYEEYQTGAQNSARSNNARLSSVLFEKHEDGRLLWRAIHETWLSEENHAAANFAF